MNNDDETRDKFYEDLMCTLAKINPRKQILFLGDFNAHVGRDYEEWLRVLGKQGVGAKDCYY